MKFQWKKLVVCLLLPLAVGGLAAFLTRNSMDLFAMVKKPPLSPPGWLFPVVWTILYLLMGFASYLVLVAEKPGRTAWKFYLAQLAFNFVWPILFFHLQMYLLSFVWLLLLWMLILVTILWFTRSSRLAGYLLIPYLLWVTFAGYLNLGIYILNQNMH
ncbi:MAG TPA: tryptophan-rich sensory protein [Candidatus Anaerobutyricum avicola]|nr:tryptophan-rich sensory protein [Candidatus Anaerobutyricum avicola]